MRIIELLIEKLSVDFDLLSHKDVLKNLYKLYQNRYLDMRKNTGECKTFIKDLDTIDYAYKYFRDRVSLSDQAKEETLINKLFLKNKDLRRGEEKFSLYNLFYKNNKYFKVPNS